MDKKALILLAAAIAGPVVADRFLIRYGAGDTSGIVDYKLGFGIDDVLVGAATFAVYMLVSKVA